MELFDKKYIYLEWDDVLEGKKVFVADCLANLRKRVNNNDHQGYSECVVDSCVEFPFRVSSGITFALAYYDPNYSCKAAYAQGKTIQYRTKDSSDAWKDCEGSPFWGEVCEYREKPEMQPTDEHVCITCIHRCPLSETNEPCKSCWHVDGRPMWKLDETVKVCGTCKYKDLPYSCSPCNECMENSVNAGEERSMWEPREPKKKRRMTNRELARWLAKGCGECLHNTIAFTVWNYLIENKDKTVSDGVKIRGWDEAEWHEPEVEE